MNTALETLDGPWLDLWFRWMVAISWQVAVLVTALLVLSWALRRHSARLRYVLWSLVPVRLILPPTLALATGWAWWVLPAQEVPRTPNVVTRSYRIFDSPPPLQTSQFMPEYVGPVRAGHAPSVTPPITPSAIPSSSTVPAAEWPWRMWLFAGWFAGVGIMLMRLLVGHRQVLQLVRRSLPVDDAAVNQLLAACRQRVGVRAPVGVHQSAEVETPLLIGVWRPVIIVPPTTRQNLTQAELETVLIHELQHIRRYDALSSVLHAVLKAVYFFHPGVWLADRWLRRLREEACDEATVSLLAGNRRDYGSAILKLAEQTLRPAPPMAIGVVESGSHITQRMRRILDPKLPAGRTLSWSALAVVLIAAATLLPAGPRQKVITQSPEEADAGVKPIEFCIFPETLPSDESSIRWVTIHQSVPNLKDHGLGKIHARQVQGKWEAAVWNTAEHTLSADAPWHVASCTVNAGNDTPMSWRVAITLDDKGGHAIRKLTSSHLEQRLAIIVDGKIWSAPIIKEVIGGQMELTGQFTKEQAENLAEVISQYTSKPKTATQTETHDSEKVAQTATALTNKPASEEPLATVHGVVVNTEGQPVPGARVVVSLWKGGNVEKTTDGTGSFEMTASRRQLRGNLVRAFASEGQQQAAMILPWEEAEVGTYDIKLKLTPARLTELHIVDQNSQPIAGAMCGILGEAGGLSDAKSNEQGHAVILSPSTMPVTHVYAWKGGAGLDYRAYVVPREHLNDKNAVAPQLPDGPVKLTLDGAHPMRVHLREPDGKPITGVDAYPWYLQRPDQPVDLNLSYLVSQFSATSNSQGELVFDWIPQWQKKSLTIWPNSDNHVRQRGSYDPQTGDGKLAITLDRLVSLRGKATHADGSPAAGISIRAQGEGYQFDDFDGATTTDANGQYELKAAPNMIYLVVANGHKLAAAPQTGFAVWPNQPVENIDFTMRPATRLHGRITHSSDKQPVHDFRVYSYQYGVSASSLAEIKLPNPNGDNKWVCPMVVRHTTTDAEGNYELYVGPGQFDIRGPSQNSVQKFEVHEEQELEFNFDAPRPESGPFVGFVKTVDGKPVAKANVTSVYRHDSPHLPFEAVTNTEGAFHVTRQLHWTVIHAASPDGKLAGIAEIDEDNPMSTITVGPLASAKGRLLDEEGKPLANQEITYGVRIHMGDNNAPFSDYFGGSTTTDSDGRFEMKSLIVGQKYHVTWATYSGPNKNNYSGKRVTDHTPLSVDPVDLGDLKQAPQRKPLTLTDQINEAFDIKGKRGSPIERFELAKRRASLSDQRVMIIFGTPTHKPIEQFMQLRFEDNDVGSALNPYRTVAINTEGEKLVAAQTLAKAFGVSLSESDAACSVHVIEPVGTLIASANEQALSEDGQVSREKLMTLLAAHTLAPRNAEAVLRDALAQAKKENKRVFLQETATWCGPCWLLSDYLDKHRATWEKDFIWVKMDQRWEHCESVMDPIRSGAQGGIPWIAILDADGKTLATSNTAQGENIGFPSDDTGRKHFRSMLEQTAIRLVADDINQLMAGLEEKK